MMESDESKIVLSMMFTNSAFGKNGVIANNCIKSTPIIDISFLHPLMLYDFIFKAAIDDIIKTVPISKNLNDFSKKIQPLTKSIIYSNLSSIIDFYTYPTDMVPNADYDTLNRGFINLSRISKSAIANFMPNNVVKTQSILGYEPLSKDIFVGHDRMMHFLCFSDIIWTIDLINSTKDSAIQSIQTLPTHFMLSIVEPPTQMFFSLYASGIKAITLNKKPTYDQLGILYMIFYIDSICYNEWKKYHTEAGLFDSSMITQADIITDNTIIIFDKISSLMETQGTKHNI